MDIEKARFNMVEQQIRPWEVLDPAVLELLFTVRREDFVPAAYRSLAFVDMEIPIGHGELMMSPKMEARILQELAPKAADRVLEIGTGSGYLTALLAHRAAHVTSIEYYEDLSRDAAKRLAQSGIHNVSLKVGDAANHPTPALPAGEQFDVIVLTGSVPEAPRTWFDALAPGGRLLAIVGDAPVMKAILYTGGAATGRELFETVVAPLINAPHASRFTF
jgi:protein-L-isoaspartate(D-aspartate) O-methyltransferase